MRTWILIGMMAAALPAWAQERPRPEKKLVFQFKDASLDAVLQYVARELGWTLVYSPNAKAEGTVTVFNDAEVPEARVIDFLNTALESSKAKVKVFQFAGVLKVLSEEEAKKGNFFIDIADDPAQIPISETVRTWVIPLRHANVVDVNKELSKILEQDGMSIAYSSYSNSVVVTGRSSGAFRIARILKIIDVQATDLIRVRVFRLRNADAQEMAQRLNDLFKKEQAQSRNPMQEMFRGMMGGGGGGGKGPEAKTLASEMIRITSDSRTNSVVAAATVENLKTIEDLLAQLDGETAEAIRLKLYPLRYADAKEIADLITRVFEDEETQNRQAQRGRSFLPVWMGGGAPSADPTGASRQVRALAELRTNSVVVAANETNLRTIDDLIANVDRQLTDILQIKIYELQNAEAAQMVSTLEKMFASQIAASRNAARGQPQPNRNPFGMFMGGGRTNTPGPSGISPSQEIEFAADARTNAVIAKASETYLAVIDEIITELDKNETETVQTHVIDLKNADADQVAQVLQSLLRGGGPAPVRNNQTSQPRTSGSTRQGGNSATRGQGNQGGGARGGGGGGRNLGPLQDPEEEMDPPQGSLQDPQEQDPEELRRGISGQVDVQADPATNSLIIRTSPRNLDALRGVIQNLDRMRPQVLIKVLIAEVTLDNDTQFGIEGFWENKFRVEGDAIRQRHGTDFNLPSQGLATLFTGDELQASLNAFAQEGKLRVLATPRVLVLDNEPAEILVGKEVPRITNSTTNNVGNIVNSVQYERLGILLEVTPHINYEGLVTMDVHPEISDIAPASESIPITEGVVSPTFFVNQARTTVAARNGQTVVIGGLIRESQNDTIQKVPILGDIPLLGLLFSSTSKETVKRELMIFLTPYVAYTTAQLEELTELEKAQLKLIDDQDIGAEADRWLERMKK